MMADFEHVDMLDCMFVEQRLDLLSFGIAGEKRLQVIASIFITVKANEEHDAVGVSSVIAILMRPYHLGFYLSST